LEKIARLRSQMADAAQASTDGTNWRPASEFEELRELLESARKADQPRRAAVAPIEKAPPPPPAPVPEAPAEVPESGDLAQHSPVKLYAIAALSSASGWLQLEMDKGHMLQISFRRGTPEHLSTDHPDLSLVRFLQSRGVLTAEKALQAEEQAQKSGQDLVSVLFQMQLIPPADAHRLLGDYSSFLLDRALIDFRGKFSFEKDAPAPPGAFPLGSRWTLLAESVRRLEAPLLRARLGKRLTWPVIRSGGLSIGKIEELALNAHETRIYSAIDGTRTGEELLQAGDAAKTLRLLYLLVELGHLSFVDTGEEEKTPPPPVSAKPRPTPPRELPKISRPPTPPPAGERSSSTPPVVAAPHPSPQPAAAPAGAAAPAPAKSAPPKVPTKPPAAAAAPAAPASIPPNRPPPKFAEGPEGESPLMQLARLGKLLERLETVDHFEALGMVRKGSTVAEAKRNFFVLARELHPDTVTDPAQAPLKQMKEKLFARINEAWQVLGDDAKRKEYEQELDGKAASVDVARIFAAEENFGRAEILIKAHKYKEGLEQIEKAIELNAAEAEFYAWRGYARFLLSTDRRGDYEQTAGDCRKAIKMQEMCLPAHLFLGHMAKALGDMKLAARCYEKVLQLDERHVEAQRELRLMGKKG
jgi:hypothetical protein